MTERYQYEFDASMPVGATSWVERVRNDARGVDWLPIAEVMGQRLAEMFEEVWGKAADQAASTYAARFDADDPLDLEPMLDGVLIEWTGLDFTEVTAEGFSAVTSSIDTELADTAEGIIGIRPTYPQGEAGEILQAATAVTIDKMKGIGQAAKDEIARLVAEGFEKGSQASTIARRIEDRVGIGRRRAQFVARNEMGNLYAEHTKLRQTELGATRYVWRTSLDERVRASHAAKEGETFSWNDPPADTGHPGEDFNCRCTAEPVLDDLL